MNYTSETAQRAYEILNDVDSDVFDSSDACFDYLIEHENDSKDDKTKAVLAKFNKYKAENYPDIEDQEFRNILASSLKQYDIQSLICYWVYGIEIPSESDIKAFDKLLGSHCSNIILPSFQVTFINILTIKYGSYDNDILVDNAVRDYVSKSVAEYANRLQKRLEKDKENLTEAKCQERERENRKKVAEYRRKREAPISRRILGWIDGSSSISRNSVFDFFKGIHADNDATASILNEFKASSEAITKSIEDNFDCSLNSSFESILSKISENFNGGKEKKYYNQDLKKWLDEGVMPNRDNFIKLCFLFSLSAKGAALFFDEVGQYPFNIRDANESALLYCLLKSRPYAVLQRLVCEYESADTIFPKLEKRCPRCGWEGLTDSDICLEIINGKQCKGKLDYKHAGDTTKKFSELINGNWENDNAFLSTFLLKNKYKLSGLSNTVYTVYSEQKAELLTFRPSNSSRAILSEIRSSSSINAGKMRNSEFTLKGFFDNFPVQNYLVNFENREITSTSTEIVRKTIIYLYFLNYMHAWDYFNDSRRGLDDFIDTLNKTLAKCNLPSIYPPNQFDFLILWAVRRFELGFLDDYYETDDDTAKLEAFYDVLMM